MDFTQFLTATRTRLSINTDTFKEKSDRLQGLTQKLPFSSFVSPQLFTVKVWKRHQCPLPQTRQNIFSASLQTPIWWFFSLHKSTKLLSHYNHIENSWNSLSGYGAGCKCDPHKQILVTTGQFFCFAVRIHHYLSDYTTLTANKMDVVA